MRLRYRRPDLSIESNLIFKVPLLHTRHFSSRLNQIPAALTIRNSLHAGHHCGSFYHCAIPALLMLTIVVLDDIQVRLSVAVNIRIALLLNFPIAAN